MPTNAEDFTAGLYKAAIESAKQLAPFFQPGYGTKEMTPQEELTLWNERKIPPEQEHDLWRQGRTPDRPGPILSPEEIGATVYPNRMQMMQAGGRIEPKDQHAYANKMAQKAEAQRQAQQADPNQPDPTMTTPAPILGGEQL